MFLKAQQSFQSKQTHTDRDIEEAVRFDVLTDGELEAAIDYSLSLIGEEGKENVAAVHVMHYVHVDHLEKAGLVFARYAAQGMAGKGDMLTVERLIARQKVKKQRGNRFTCRRKTIIQHEPANCRPKRPPHSYRRRAFPPGP